MSLVTNLYDLRGYHLKDFIQRRENVMGILKRYHVDTKNCTLKIKIHSLRRKKKKIPQTVLIWIPDMYCSSIVQCESFIYSNSKLYLEHLYNAIICKARYKHRTPPRPFLMFLFGDMKRKHKNNKRNGNFSVYLGFKNSLRNIFSYYFEKPYLCITHY